MAFTDFAITAAILIFMILIIWARVQQQSMLDTMQEIKDIFNKVILDNPVTEKIK